MNIDINCDMGEGVGNWKIGDDPDEMLMPYVSSINLAAGFHAGDPNLINKTIINAKKNNLNIGVHPGFRDLLGFGRRHINANNSELVNDVVYQIGAVREFIKLHDLSLSHLKLHGALYMHAAADEEFSELLIKALQLIDKTLPVFVMGNSVIAKVAQKYGQPIIREFYADRLYNDEGSIVFTRNAGNLEPQAVADKVLQACKKGTVTSINNKEVSVEFESICVHSDTAGALQLLKAISIELDQNDIKIAGFDT